MKDSVKKDFIRMRQLSHTYGALERTYCQIRAEMNQLQNEGDCIVGKYQDTKHENAFLYEVFWC